jgi:hypothetical protein
MRIKIYDDEGNQLSESSFQVNQLDLSDGGKDAMLKVRISDVVDRKRVWEYAATCKGITSLSWSPASYVSGEVIGVSTVPGLGSGWTMQAIQETRGR